MRRLRTRRQPVKQLPAFVFALGLDAVPQNELGSRLMHARIVAETSTLERSIDGPASEHLGDFRDVALRVAAVHAERVQFQQLASVIFVQTAVLFALRVWVWSGETTREATRIAPAGAIRAPRTRRNTASLRRVWSHAQPVIQVKQHGWTLSGGDEQIFELAKNARTNDVLLVAGEQQTIEALAHIYIEVVEPEIGHHLFELALAVDGPQQLGLDQFVHHNARRVVH